MKLAYIIICIIFLNILFIGSCVRSKYNSLIDSRENVREKVGNLHAQYQRRYDLTYEIVKTIQSERSSSKDIKASQGLALQDLRASLEGTENRINFYRSEYNNAIRIYNVSLCQFPNNIYAKSLGFKEFAYFESDTLASSIRLSLKEDSLVQAIFNIDSTSH